MKNIEIGKLGEDIAFKIIKNKGWIIIARNYKYKGDETDLIAIDHNKILVFIEVKTLIKNTPTLSTGLSPEDNLTPHKLRKMSRACNSFANRHSHLINEEKGWRMDLIAIELFEDGKPKAIRHYENILA